MSVALITLPNVKYHEIQGDAAELLASALFKRGVARAVHLKRHLGTVTRSSTSSRNNRLLFGI